MHLKIVVLGFVFCCFGIAAGSANDEVSVSLYLAENIPPPPQALVAPEKLHHRLREVFGFEHYELLKRGEIDLKSHWEQWVLPRKDFFIRLEPLPNKTGETPLLDYELYKDGFIVAKGQYEPHEGTPLFINGPDFKQGRLIFVLEAR
jgi:hypothetical protein